ncbi:hypothetical protein QWJ90_12140 [Microbacterium oryzae]|uniref:hypothetical protein n=1 Tax=Microbacterium oryzae TaxID=743009 RepID=UPI0025AEFB7C|nr:hypothetical protein [Microbacterium oryzae]MDN3311682.1 hypothetical protein [Microbacterium oryzae]
MLRVILLLVDAIILAGYLAFLWNRHTGGGTDGGVFASSGWNGDADGSHAEIFGHWQLIGGAVMLVFLSVARRAPLYGAWAFAFLALTADDLFLIHERAGGFLWRALSFSPTAGLRPVDLGELCAWGAEGLVVGAVLLIATLRARRRARRDSLTLFVLVLVLAVFAVGIDQLHIIVEPHVPHLVAVALTLLETGGELVGMTLLVLAVHAMAIRPGGVAPSVSSRSDPDGLHDR